MQGLPSDLLQRTIRRCEEEGRTPVVRVIEAPSDCKEIRAAAASDAKGLAPAEELTDDGRLEIFHDSLR